jgi:hypothetical protein
LAGLWNTQTADARRLESTAQEGREGGRIGRIEKICVQDSENTRTGELNARANCYRNSSGAGMRFHKVSARYCGPDVSGGGGTSLARTFDEDPTKEILNRLFRTGEI